MNIEKYLDLAYDNLAKSYSPYSKFQVSCVGILTNGKVFCGVNVENASFGASICAERSMITNICTQGENPHNLESIIIISSGEKICLPCGICRQTLVEFIKPDTKFILANKYKDYKIYTFNDLFPLPFDVKDLNV